MITNKDIDNVIESIINSAADSSAEFIIKESGDSSLNRNELTQELKQHLQIKTEKERIDSGFDHIVKYMESRLTSVEISEIKSNWEKSLNNFIKIMEKKEQSESEEQSNSLQELVSIQELIGITDETFEKFYTSGLFYYEHKMFNEAADVFFVLIFLNNWRHNVWISFGLSEYQCGRMELALNAFSMAAITNINTPLPYMYSAQCCIQMGNNVEAELYLELAEEKINADPTSYNYCLEELKKLKKNLY